MSGPVRPDPDRGSATPGGEPRTPPEDEFRTTALPRKPRPDAPAAQPGPNAGYPSGQHTTVPTQRPSVPVDDDAATTWYPRPDPAPPQRPANPPDDGAYYDRRGAEGYYDDRRDRPPAGYREREDPRGRYRPDDRYDRQRGYDEGYRGRDDRSDYPDYREYPPGSRRSGGYREDPGYRDDPGYRPSGYRPGYPPDYRDDRDYRGYRGERDYRDERGYPDDRDYRDERDYRNDPQRRTYDDRPYLEGDAYAPRRDPRPIPRAPEPYDYLPPGEPMPGGGEIEPVRRHQPSPRGSHLPPYQEPLAVPLPPGADAKGVAVPSGTGGKTPRKLTVTRVAALRSREITRHGVEIFQRAAKADGADRSGLTHLTYAVMANYAVDAALAIALANTLFFAAASAESSGKVLLYLLITVAPFAVIAPLIGPALDRLQNGRRLALAASSFARAVLAIVMVFQFDSWVLYPCALGMLVLSKSFGVLKGALTPRVLPDEITLVKTNSRLTVFGLIAGGVSGAVAAGLAWAFGSAGALVFTAIVAVVGGVLCLRIPAWVESTAGEVPVNDSIQLPRPGRRAAPTNVVTTLWANSTIRVETGFLALFIAFVVKSQFPDVGGFQQLMLLSVVGVAAGLGGFIGNGLGARLPLDRPEKLSIIALGTVIVSTVIAVLVPGLATAALVGLIGSTSSSLAKVCLDSVIQHEIPEESRASAFGRSETALQLSWVFGGVIGLLIGGVLSFGAGAVYVVGFGTITVLLVLGLTQTILMRSGRTLIPAFLRRKGRKTSGPSSAPPGAPTTPATAAGPAGTTATSAATSAAADIAPHTAKPRKATAPRPSRRGRKAGDPR